MKRDLSVLILCLIITQNLDVCLAKTLGEKRIDSQGADPKQALSDCYQLLPGQDLALYRSLELPERVQYLRHVKQKHPDPVLDTIKPEQVSFVFRWDGTLRENGSFPFASSLGMGLLLEFGMQIKSYKYEINSKRSYKLPLGDLVVRDNLTTDQKMMAFNHLLGELFDPTVQFQKTEIEQNCLVVKGTYEFKPLEALSSSKDLYLAVDTNDIEMFSNYLAQDRNINYGEADSLAEFCSQLSQKIGMPIFYEAESASAPVTYQTSCRLLRLREKTQQERFLPYLIQNIEKQTSLDIVVEKRPMWVWILSDSKT